MGSLLQLRLQLHVAQLFSEIRTRYPNGGNQQPYHWATPLSLFARIFFEAFYASIVELIEKREIFIMIGTKEMNR